MSRVQVPSPAPITYLTMKLKVSVKNINSCEKILTIDVPEEVVSNEFACFYDAMAGVAKIPGFRPGHAPRQVVALHYREEARRRVLEQLLRQSFREAVIQEKIALVGEPKVDEIQFDECHLKFNAHVETRPKIKIDNYVGLPLTRRPIEVRESEVEEMLKRLQEVRAKFVAVEDRPCAVGDFLICDYALTVDGKELEKREGEWIELREHDFLEGFSKQLIGATFGETRQVVIAFPPDHRREECKGKSGVFSVTVKEIKEKRLAAIDDEFAKEVGDYNTLQELKHSIRKDLEAEKNKEQEVHLEHDLLDLLIKKSRFDVPTPMVERRVASLVENEIRTLFARGRKPEELKSEQESLRQKLAPDAHREVRIAFILDEIASREGIEVTETDLATKYEEAARSFRRPVEQIKAYYREHDDRRVQLLHQVKQEKTIQWLKDRANIKDMEK